VCLCPACRAADAAGDAATTDGLHASSQPAHPQLSNAAASTSCAAPASDAPPDSELGKLRGQVATASAVTFVTRRALANCTRIVSNGDPPYVAEDVDIDVALMHLKDEALGLFNELQRQARQAPRFEAQITAASQRVEELEEQVHELEAENHVLAAGGTGVAAGAAMATGRATPSYADDDNLALSAMEQQLALAESKQHELQASVESLASENARLVGEVSTLQAELQVGKCETLGAVELQNVTGSWHLNFRGRPCACKMLWHAPCISIYATTTENSMGGDGLWPAQQPVSHMPAAVH
jgi:regulator of replication initiation timing